MARIRDGEVVRICSLGHYIPAYVKLAAHSGYDCIWLDLEHRHIDYRSVQALLALAHRFDIDIMVRPPTLERTGLYRFLEDGASGLMIPHVTSVQMAEDLKNAVKFPPLGDRGLDGAGLDADYMTGDAQEYLQQANEETFLVIQIEAPKSVEIVEEIAAVKGIDGIFVGPGDLGLRIATLPTELTIDSAVARVAAACQQNQIAWGMPVATKEQLQQRREQGGQLLAHGGEFGALRSMLETSVADYS